jgi:hypothetical protein
MDPRDLERDREDGNEQVLPTIALGGGEVCTLGLGGGRDHGVDVQ